MKAILFVVFYICLLNSSSAQQVFKNKKQKNTFLEQVSMPVAQPSFLIEFGESILQPDKLDTTTTQSKWDGLSTFELLDIYSDDIKNYSLTLALANRYNKKKDFDNAYYYYEQAYQLLNPLLEQYPDSFELFVKMADLYLAANQGQENKDLWSEYAQAHPNESKAWSKLASVELMFEADITDGKGYNQKAYELDNNNLQTYVNAIVIAIKELISILAKANTVENSKEKIITAPQINTAFFDRAIKETNSYPARLGKDACLLIQVTLNTIIANSDAKIGTQKVKLKLQKEQAAIINQLRANANKLIETSAKNPLFAHKILTITDVLLNKPEKAEKNWAKVNSKEQMDADVYKWLSLGYMLQLNYEKAAEYSTKATQIAPSYEDYFSLSRLYIFDEKYTLANTALDKALLFNPNDYRAFVAKVAILWRQEKWQQGIDLMNTILPSLVNNPQKQHLYYYQTLSLLLQNKLEEARKRLEQLQKDGDYKQEAKVLYKQFY